MITIQIPPPYRPYTDHISTLSVEGNSVSEIFIELLTRFPALTPHLKNPRGEIRPFINVFVNGANVKTLNGLNTKLKPGDVVQFIPSIAGG